VKIGIIARTWFTSTKGGSERYIARLFEELRRSHEVKVVTFDRSEDRDVIQIKLPRISLVTQALFSFLASRKMNAIKPDVCLVNQYWAEFSPLLLKVPWIPIIHDVGLFYSERAQRSFFKHFVRTGVLGEVARRARLIVVPSQLTADDLRSYLKVPKERIKIVPEGVDLDKFRSSPIRHRGINLVCAGRIAPNKGQDVLLLAFKAVKEKYPDCRLYLVGGVLGGQKDYYNKLRRLAETLNLGDVVFTGYVSDEDLVRYYSLADIYVQPSVGEEGWGMGIVEAFACGKPVVCSDIFYRTGVADVDRALIVKGGDSRGLAKAIELLIEDEELRKRLAKNGYKFAQKLSWKRMADDVLQAINSLVSDKKKI
jgi:glycosyltransferase involved in cell wall biosynthesis